MLKRVQNDEYKMFQNMPMCFGLKLVDNIGDLSKNLLYIYTLPNEK